MEKLKEGGMNSDVIGMIMKEAGGEKAISLLKEKSIFPSPTSENPDFMNGGFILIGLKRFESSGTPIVRIRVRYTRLDGSEGLIEKDIDLRDAEVAVQQKKGGFASSEGMAKVIYK